MFAEIILQPVDWAPSRLDPGPIELPNGKRRWRRNQVACDACHARRVRCDMVYSSPCSRCKHKNVECAITRERRKRGRRGRAERANAKRIHETLVHDTPTTQEEARQNETCSDDESLPASSPIDMTVTDPATRPNTPATDNIEIGDNSDSEKTGTCSNTSSSQILEELGMGLTEDCLPTAHLFQGFLDLSAENDISLPPLPDIFAADDITLHAASDLPSESSIPSPQTVDHLLSPNDKPKPVCDDSIYAAELETADFLLVDLLETATYGANMSMSCFLATRIETESFYGELYCSG